MNYLCDTNVISEAMKRSPNPRVKQWLSEQEIVCLSVITVEEIYYGLAYKNAQKQLEWFEKLLRFRGEVLPITFAIAKHCGILRGKFRKKGITRTQADMRSQQRHINITLLLRLVIYVILRIVEFRYLIHLKIDNNYYFKFHNITFQLNSTSIWRLRGNSLYDNHTADDFLLPNHAFIFSTIE